MPNHGLDSQGNARELLEEGRVYQFRQEDRVNKLGAKFPAFVNSGKKLSDSDTHFHLPPEKGEFQPGPVKHKITLISQKSSTKHATPWGTGT